MGATVLKVMRVLLVVCLLNITLLSQNLCRTHAKTYLVQTDEEEKDQDYHCNKCNPLDIPGSVEKLVEQGIRHANREIGHANREVRQAKQEIGHANQEVRQAKQEIGHANREIQHANQEIQHATRE